MRYSRARRRMIRWQRYANHYPGLTMTLGYANAAWNASNARRYPPIGIRPVSHLPRLRPGGMW